MSSNTRNLINALKTQTFTFLGTDYEELRNVYNIEQNPNLETTLGYGILAEDVVLVSGNLGFNTVDQTFSVVLTDYYVSTKEDDLCKQDAVIALLDKCQDLYNEYVKTKLNLNSIIINIDEMNVSIEELDEDKTVVARMQFIIKYRHQLC